MAPDTGMWVAQILNDAYMVRHYVRGGRNGIGKLHREQAVQKLGLTIREAFVSTNDYDSLLAAILDGLRPVERMPF
jgi:hypothetical protein